MATGQYILEGGAPKQVDNLIEWANWMSNGDRRVANTQISNAHVSTVFLGLDHNWAGGPPILFETMVFRYGKGEDYERYSTLEEAMHGHELMVDTVRKRWWLWILPKRIWRLLKWMTI